MAEVAFHKVTSLPSELDANSFYLVENGSYIESYLTDDGVGDNDDVTAKQIGNSTMINALVDTKINALTSIEQVADITARDTLGTSISYNAMILVADASADSTVAAGAALYFYDAGDNEYTKVSEYESLDLTLSWSNLTGKPTSTVTQIDAAVSASHTHSNSAVLNALSVSGGLLQYNNAAVGATTWATLNW